MGFSDNPQNYIVDVYRSSQADTWAFKKPFDSDTQTFNHYVSVQYIEISQDNITSLSYIKDPVNKIPSDFWYPFYIHSSGISQVALNALMLCIITIGVLF